MKPAVTIRESQLGALFRAYIKVDAALVVRSAGPFFLSRETEVVPGARLAELFSLRHDRLDEQAVRMETAIPAMADTPERLELFCKSKNIRLAGIVFSTEDGGFLLALNIVPEDFIIEGQGLHISDFSQIDASVPALTLIGMQRALLAEARQAAIDLANAQSEALELLDRTQRLGRYIVHDLTNYLSIIRLNVANLAQSGGNAETSRAAIEAATRHVSDLVLSLERLTGHRDVEATPISVDQTIRSNLAFLSAALPSDFTLDFIGGAAQAAVRVGRTELVTMLTNVIVHARGAMPDGGSITISSYRTSEPPERHAAAAAQDWAVIKVIHDGPAIDDETVRLMLDPQTLTPPEGTDFPLRSVRTWARSAGGDARITALPAGTDICIHLPISGDADELELAPAAGPGTALPRMSRSARVLVVEDEVHALDAVVEILRMEGYAVTPALNAAQAVEALAEADFDILLTDVVMPERSGVELAHEVEARHPRIGIILMSGYLPDESLLQPHWPMLRKPLDLGLLSQTLASTHARLVGTAF
ncbi:MAG: response regulator [Sphingomonadales bacterium]|nr:response regulator [Sphingomonadales bacterium]